MKSRLRSTNLAGFYPVVEVGGGASAPKHPALLHGKRKGKEREKERERERERKGGGGSVYYVFGATTYLINLRLTEYQGLKSITPQCH